MNLDDLPDLCLDIICQSLATAPKTVLASSAAFLALSAKGGACQHLAQQLYEALDDGCTVANAKSVQIEDEWRNDAATEFEELTVIKADPDANKTLVELRSLCKRVGCAVSGTKAVVTKNLQDAIESRLYIVEQVLTIPKTPVKTCPVRAKVRNLVKALRADEASPSPSLITATLAKSMYKMTEEMLEELPCIEKNNPYRRSMTMRLFVETDVMCVNMLHHGVADPAKINPIVAIQLKVDGKLKEQRRSDQLVEAMEQACISDEERGCWKQRIANFVQGHGAMTEIGKIIGEINDEKRKKEERCARTIESERIMQDIGLIRPTTNDSHYHTINSFIRGSSTIESFTASIHNMKAARGRKADLIAALLKEGCVLRSDSQLCSSYIEDGYGRIDDIVSVMREMKFYFAFTDYQSILQSYGRRDYDSGSEGEWEDRSYTPHPYSGQAKSNALARWWKYETNPLETIMQSYFPPSLRTTIMTWEAQKIARSCIEEAIKLDASNDWSGLTDLFVAESSANFVNEATRSKDPSIVNTAYFEEHHMAGVRSRMSELHGLIGQFRQWTTSVSDLKKVLSALGHSLNRMRGSTKKGIDDILEHDRLYGNKPCPYCHGNSNRLFSVRGLIDHVAAKHKKRR